MSSPDFGIFDNEAARTFVAELRESLPTAVGDTVSAAVRSVAQAESPLTEPQVRRALAAIGLLLSEFDPEITGDANDDVRTWFAALEIELNPARRQVTGAALDRILVPADNGWYDAVVAAGDEQVAVAAVNRLREVLADSAADE